MVETARVILKSFSEGDAPLLVDLDSDPRVMKFLSDGKPTSLDEAQKTIERLLSYKKMWNQQMGTWPAYHKPTGTYMGWYLLRPDKKHLSDTKNIELGYRLKYEFWGQGYGSEVSKALLKKAFMELNCDTVFAHAMEGNEGSTGVMKKVGMKFHSHYIETEFPGKDKRGVRYLITRDEWLAQSRGESAT